MFGYTDALWNDYHNQGNDIHDNIPCPFVHGGGGIRTFEIKFLNKFRVWSTEQLAQVNSYVIILTIIWNWLSENNCDIAIATVTSPLKNTHSAHSLPSLRDSVSLILMWTPITWVELECLTGHRGCLNFLSLNHLLRSRSSCKIFV
jgi:hypothetical protein